MYIKSALPLVGLALVGTSSAAAITHVHHRRTNIEGYSYLGCYTDSVSSRSLTGASYTDSSGMTLESCVAFCSSKGYQVAGTEYSSECYCGYQFTTQPQQVSDDQCNMSCSGDSSESCGAGDRLSVYTNGQAAPVTNPGTGGYTLIGCFNDSPSSRTLSYPINPASGNTVSNCVAACSAAGYPYAGVEYGSECYCDTAVRNGASIQNSGCDMVCSSNSSEYCGGSARIDIYENFNTVSSSSSSTTTLPAGWTSLGCYTDSPSSRTLANMGGVSGGASNMTVEGCLNYCSGAGFAYGGVEYGQECWCDHAIENGAGPASDPSVCHDPCTGNHAETCGGSNALNLYSYGGSS